ncbi:MAG: hypothetical protein BWY24_00442 [Microgenomates group bacterium ADurb.Bin219]|nr:MAG: hypothetical protein BWY24_00442 [Microgenomates group bacterium ADurb.Bin219]
MKIYFPKYFKVVITLFFVLVGLTLAKLINFDFGLDLRLFFLAFLIPFWIYFFLEVIANRKFVWKILSSESKKKKTEIEGRAKNIQPKIVGLSSLFSSDLGRDLVLAIAYLVAFTFELVDFIKRYFFSKYIFLFYCFLGILLEIFIITSTLDSIILFLTGMWVIVVRMFRFKAKISMIGSLCYLSICPFLLIYKKDLWAEKTANWAYLFLAIGVIQMFVEIFDEERQDAQAKK